MILSEASSLYEDFYVIEKGLSANTSLGYRNDLKIFCSYLKERGVIHTEGINKDHLTEFLEERGKIISEQTLNREKSVLKNFLIYCLNLKGIKEDFSYLLRSGGREDFFPSVLTREEMSCLFEFCQKKIDHPASSYQYLLAERNYLMLEMLYAMGVRVSELTGIRLTDLDEEGWCRVIGKGSKTRYVPLLPRTLKRISAYLEKIRPQIHKKTQTQPYLFLNKNGKKLSRITIWKWVKETSKLAGISKDISPHTFRHTCATHLLQNGADLRMIQELVGHSNIQTTELYTHLLTDDIKKTFADYHPLYL